MTKRNHLEPNIEKMERIEKDLPFDKIITYTEGNCKCVIDLAQDGSGLNSISFYHKAEPLEAPEVFYVHDHTSWEFNKVLVTEENMDQVFANAKEMVSFIHKIEKMKEVVENIF